MIIPNQKARAIIDNIKYIAVASVDGQGQPWNTPVAGFHFENNYDFYWASWADNQHSKNIRENGKAFISIYDSTPESGSPSEGVYIMAEAIELTDPEQIGRAALVFEGDSYNPTEGKYYLSPSPRRIYMARPIKIWMNGDDEVNGSFVDRLYEAEAGQNS